DTTCFGPSTFSSSRNPADPSPAAVRLGAFSREVASRSAPPPNLFFASWSSANGALSPKSLNSEIPASHNHASATRSPHNDRTHHHASSPVVATSLPSPPSTPVPYAVK